MRTELSEELRRAGGDKVIDWEGKVVVMIAQTSRFVATGWIDIIKTVK